MSRGGRIMMLTYSLFCLMYMYVNAGYESKCATADKNETGHLHCQEHKYIHIEKIWTDEDKCIVKQSANVLHEIHNMSCRSNSSCDVKHETNSDSKYLNVIYRCANCLPLTYNTTSEIACRTNMVIEIYDVWITSVHEHCPGFKQTHIHHTFNAYVPVKREFSQKCNKKSRCKIYNSNHLTASVYYHCKGEDGLVDMARNTSRQGVVIAAVVVGILIIVGILVAVCIFRYRIRRRTAHNNNMKTEPEIISEQYEVPNEHQNGDKNYTILNLSYEIASSIGYSHGLTSAALDSNAEQYELQKEHTNGGKNKAILSSPYDMASSIEYSFEMTSAEPDFIAEQYELPKEHTNGGKNSAIVNSPYKEIASSIEYAYAITKSEPDSICVKNTGGSNEHLRVKGNGTTGKLSFDIVNPKSSTYSHLRDADGGSDITYDHTSHGRVQRTPEGDYGLSCNRITEDEYNISDNYNVSFSKDSDYNQF